MAPVSNKSNGKARKAYVKPERIYTPGVDQQCFFCPLLGWKCRRETTPPCVASSRMHKEYKQAVASLEMYA